MKIQTCTENDARFIYYSIRERLAAYEIAPLLGWDITNVSEEEGSASWDLIYSAGTEFNIGEIKLRKQNLHEFDEAEYPGLIFEKKKYDALMTLSQSPKGIETNIQPKFILVLKDCIAIYDVNKVQPTDFKMVNLRSKSVNGSDAREMKNVTYLQPEEFTIINHIVNTDNISIRARIIFEYRYPNTKLIL